MKNKRIWIIVGIVVVILIIAYFWYRNYQIKKRQALIAQTTPQGTSSPPSPSGGSSGTYSDAFPLKNGSRGNNVVAAQMAINEGCAALSSKIAEDGIFGPQTEAAADICLGNMPGHQDGKISYAEFQSLRKKIGSATELRIKEGCTASELSRLTMKTVYGIDCDARGY